MSDSDTLARALGWSLALAPVDPLDGAACGLDLDLAGGEFRTVSGEAALIQSLTCAFVTLRGSDLFNGAFGFNGLAAIAEEDDATIRRERVRMAVIATLQAEPRITRVLTVRFDDELGNAPVSPTVVPRSRTVAVQAVFETLAGVQQTISLGGEVLDVR